MPRGGYRPGSGSKKGATRIVSELARVEAKLSGMLPHEWLLKVVRGEPIEQQYVVDVLAKDGKTIVGQEVRTRTVYPDFPTRVDAAKAVAPYYAPRLATQVITLRGREDMLNQMSDDALDAAIKELATPPSRRKKKSGDDQG